jgi:hypothetical protein
MYIVLSIIRLADYLYAIFQLLISNDEGEK